MTDLPTSTPEEQGIASNAIAAFVDGLEQAGLDPHSLVVVRHGHVVASGWWDPYQRGDIALLYSLSKSFTSTAVGLAVGEGKLSTSDTVSSFFADSMPADADPWTQAMTVHDLLSMATGHEEDTLPRLAEHLDDPSRGFLSLPPDAEPGTLFTYNNGATFMLSLILANVTGTDLLDYLRPRLFEPLGIGPAHWLRTGPVRQGFSGLHLTTDAIARLGLLYLHGGEVDGRRVLDPDWVKTATSEQVANVGRADNLDWQQGYGYQFWMARHGFRGDGAYGQYCLVLPELDAVVAMTSATEDMQAELDLAWSVLLPGFADAPLPADPEALAQLRRHLDSAQVPMVAATAEPATSGPFTLSAVGPASESDALIGPVRVESAETSADGSPGGVEGRAAWVLTLADDAMSLRLPCGSGTWIRTAIDLGDAGVLEFGVSGGWTTPTRFEAKVVDVHSPHRLDVVADVDAGVATLTWGTVPLRNNGRLRWMAMPRDVLSGAAAGVGSGGA